MMQFLDRLFNNEYLILQILIAEVIFAFHLPRRKHFALRASICVIVMLFAAFFVMDNFLSFINSVSVSVRPYLVMGIFFSMFAVTVAAMVICFCGSLWNILFCAVGAYATQNMANSVEQLFVNVFQSDSVAVSRLIMLISFTAIYTLMYFLFVKRLRRDDCTNIDNKMIIMLAALIVLLCVVFNTYAMTFMPTQQSKIVFRGVLVLCCFVALCFQFGLLSQGKLQREKEAMERMLNEKKNQYEISKENIELINIKCHDLKHQIRTIRNSEGAVDKSALKEIESAISIYDSVVKTGNDILDIILTEKSLAFEKEGIKLNIIADGEKLSFMNAIDLYALFGNALDNAFEAVKKLEDREMRIIGLKVTATGGLLSVNVQNYFSGNLSIDAGLPATTKGDNKYHGYGMKSINLIISKYSGSLSFSVNDNIFNLNIVLPLE